MNTTFTDGITVVTADWLNDVNDTVYDILGDGTNPPTDAATLLANLGGATITDVTDAIANSVGVTTQAYSANLDEFAAVNPTAAGLALLDDVDAAAQRDTLGLGSDATGSNLSSLTDITEARTNLGAQVTLISGTNIKTVNGTTLLGSGDLVVSTTVSDGDKGDITVSGGGTVWTVDPGIIPTGITQGTAINTTSGTAHDFTGIPAGVTRITAMFSGVSTNGTSIPILQIGAGSVDTSGYVGAVAEVSANSGLYSNGIPTAYTMTSTAFISGIVTLVRVTGNTWTASIGTYRHDPSCYHGGSIKTLSGSLDRIRLTTVNGTDLFDAGQINILYE